MKKQIARVKAINTLHELIERRDNETLHQDADWALVVFLRDIGEQEVAQAYMALKEKREFWYA